MSEKPKILLGSPIHQKPSILSEFLHSLSELQTEVDFYFIDDNIDARSKALLQQFKQSRAELGEVIIHSSAFKDQYNQDEYTHHWNEHLIWKVAQFKDEMIAYARKSNYDYLLLVDSDLLLHPHTINKLVESEKDIISEIFWTKWRLNSIEEPQVWLKDQYSQVESTEQTKDDKEKLASTLAFYLKLRLPGVYKVGGLGACTLISKKAMQAGVSFQRIYNLSFSGEDRHFCVRAAALGFELYVETTYPAYHLYRQADFKGLEAFRQESGYLRSNPFSEAKEARLTLSMTVRNEADKFLKEVLTHAKNYIDDAVIIDDNSTDDTKKIIHEVFADIPYVLIENNESKFHNEVELRKQQWNEVIKTNPDWIINLDADEIFEEAFISGVRELINQSNVYLYSFRLYDFWSETEYRDDNYWQAHLYYRPFLIKYVDSFPYRWHEAKQHCGRLPYNAYDLPNKVSQYRVKHYGWSREEIRKNKFERYMRLDPNGQYGIMAQYKSILDEQPKLVNWEE